MINFFIIGSPRSGTTLLRLILNSHREIGIPGEFGFIYRFFSKDLNKLSLSEITEEICIAYKFDNWDLSKERVNEIVENWNYKDKNILFRDLYLAEIDSSCSIVGDKNNFFLNHIEDIHKISPKSKFIHIIRDGRDVLTSYLSLRGIKGKYAPNLPTSLEEASNYWLNSINTIRSSFENIPQNQYIELRYEDLVLDTKNVLEKICFFLNIDFDNEMLNFYNNKSNYDKGMENWKSMNNKPVQDSKVGIYLKRFFDEDILFLNNKLRGILEEYNYSTEFLSNKSTN